MTTQVEIPQGAGKTNNPNGIVVVRGKQGCGKTRDKDALARFFQCEHIVDDVGYNIFHRPHMHNMKSLQNQMRQALTQPGRVLILTCAEAHHVEYAMHRHFPTLFAGVFEYDEVMTTIKSGTI